MKQIKITFSGDIMLHSEMVDLYKKQSGYDFTPIFEDVSEFLKKSDYVVGNLETPLSFQEADIKKEKYTFTAPEEFAKAIKSSGFNLVSTANNHCLDNGVTGVDKTIEVLDSVGLKHTGTFKNNRDVCIEQIHNLKIAFLSYTYGTNAFNNKVYLKKSERYKVNLLQNQELSNRLLRFLYYNKSLFIKILRFVMRKLHIFQFQKQPYERIEKKRICEKKLQNDVKLCKQQNVDYIVVCLHDGGQYNLNPIKRAKKNMKFLKKIGVDFVVGNHEHRVQKIEKQNYKIFAYCLGNFDGYGGVLRKPFDKFGEYSLLLNLYLSEKENDSKATVTILKTIIDPEIDGGVKTTLLYELIHKTTNKKELKKLMDDNQKIIKIALGRDIDFNDIQVEYEIL